jgi:hypothetical protein
MKKLFLLAAACYCLQLSSSAQSLSPKASPDGRQTISLVTGSAGLDRAQHHFNSNYRSSSDALWTTLPGDGFVCRFQEPEMINYAHYDRRGKWLCTVSGYEAEGLPKEVREAVQACFDGYRITYVNEITSKAVVPVYLINIESYSSVKVIRVMGDEIEVREDMKKS